jgi:peptide/nickel transport system permease protein
VAVRTLAPSTRQPTSETAPPLAAAAAEARSSGGAAASVRRTFVHNRVALGAACFILLVVAAGLLAPVLAPYDPIKQSLLARLEPPSPEHWLGTDEIGRDELSRLLYGARTSLFIGFIGTVGGVLLGSLLGMLSGYFGGWTDTLLMRVIDVMYAFPGILLAILIVSIMGPGLTNLMIALTIWGTPTLSRIVRSVILSLKEQEFVLAAQAMGATRTRIILYHLLPNTTAPIIVYATLGVAGSLLTAAGLGFLGIGVQPPTPEWGAMLSTGRGFLRDAPHLMVFPGVMIFLTVMSLNIAGDALRDALDPYLRS